MLSWESRALPDPWRDPRRRAGYRWRRWALAAALALPAATTGIPAASAAAIADDAGLRVIGVRWLGAVLYPDAFPADLRAQTRAFYRMFYHTDLTEAQLDPLLGSANRR
ncbi:MAG: hypothetical protein ACOZDY_09500 [Pseudomonadota bacterium]